MLAHLAPRAAGGGERRDRQRTAHLPDDVGLIGSSTVVGRIITRTGRYKRYILIGAVLVPVGLAPMGTISDDTSLVLVGAYMLVLGAGVGMLMQLVLAVQNVVPAREPGAASSNIAFFRTMGGAIGVARSARCWATGSPPCCRSGSPTPACPPPRSAAAARCPRCGCCRRPRTVVQSSYADGISELFLVAAPIALVSLVAVVLLKEVPLSTRTAAQQIAEEAGRGRMAR